MHFIRIFIMSEKHLLHNKIWVGLQIRAFRYINVNIELVDVILYTRYFYRCATPFFQTGKQIYLSTHIIFTFGCDY